MARGSHPTRAGSEPERGVKRGYTWTDQRLRLQLCSGHKSLALYDGDRREAELQQWHACNALFGLGWVLKDEHTRGCMDGCFWKSWAQALTGRRPVAPSAQCTRFVDSIPRGTRWFRGDGGWPNGIRVGDGCHDKSKHCAHSATAKCSHHTDSGSVETPLNDQQE